MMRNQILFAYVVLSWILSATGTAAEPSLDRRLGPPRRVTEGSDFKPWTDRTAWDARVKYLREKTLVANGLWPLPAKCPLNPKITATIDGGDYLVENVYFSSYPGFYV